MNRSLRRFAAVTAGVLAFAPGVLAQESVFGIRGLGLVSRPMSARAAATGGAFNLFDAPSSTNPAALARWRTMVGWAVGQPTRRRFEDGSSEATRLVSTRFPLFGFATIPGRRLVVGMSISDYLNRTWAVRESVTVTPRGEPQPAIDVKASTGGVSDIRFAAAYRLTPLIEVGLSLHALAGSARQSVVRDFRDSNYVDFIDLAITEYTGRGLSLGLTASLAPRVVVAGSARFNSRLTARRQDGARARVSLPTELNAGVLVIPARGVSLAASGGWAGWSTAGDALVAAGDERSRDVTHFSVGGEFDTFRRGGGRVPLRLGYRWRDLPFTVGGETITERALAGGFALDLAGGRTTIDLGVERGSRSVGAMRESFLSGYFGVILRP